MKEIEIEDEVSDEICEKRQATRVQTGSFRKVPCMLGLPDCRNTKPIIKDIGVTSQSVRKDMSWSVEVKGRIFYGCDKYPECDFVSWDKPSAKPCPSCGSLMIENRNKKGTRLQCTSCDHQDRWKNRKMNKGLAYYGGK